MFSQAVPSMIRSESLPTLEYLYQVTHKRNRCGDHYNSSIEEPKAKWAHLEEPSPCNEEYYDLPSSDATSGLSEPTLELEFVDVEGSADEAESSIEPAQLEDHIDYLSYADAIRSGEPNQDNQDENQICLGFVFPGTSINVNGVLGSGAFGLVIETYYNGSTNAVKIVRNSTEREKRHNKKEAHILNDIAHSSETDLLVKCFESFPYGNTMFFVMEKMEIDLSAYMKENQYKPLHASIVMYMGAQIFEGLSKLLDIGYCHADLKPSNILLVDTDNKEHPLRIKIADFGNSVHVDDLERTRKMQTPIYRCPELHLSRPGNKSIDTWSAGVTLFYLYTGENLYTGNDTKQMLKQIHENVPVLFENEKQEADILSTEVPERAYTERGFDKIGEMGLNFLEEEELCSDDRTMIELMNHIMVTNPDERPTPEEAYVFLMDRQVPEDE